MSVAGSGAWRVAAQVAVRTLLAGTLASSVLAAQTTPIAQTTPTVPATQLVMLGTGTPNADPERSGPAVAVVRNGRSYLVDAGPGIVRRANAAATAGVAALAPPNLRVLFLTHLHSDHTVGLPDLILTPWVLERDVPLEVYGPPGTKAMVDHLLAAYSADIRNRLDGLEPANENGYKVNVHEIGAGQIFSDGNVRVTAIAVPHGDWEHAFGYRFDSADRSIVISGDARAGDALVQACSGCDLLVHEVISAERLKSRTPEWQAYHARAHTSTVELAELGMRAAPKLLLLYHQLGGGLSDEELIAEMRRAGYARPIQSARDLGIY